MATLIAPLLVTPMMLNYFGEADFGIWATAVSITSMAVIADLGIGNGLLTRIGAAFGREDYGAIRGYVSTAYVALLGVAAGLLLILFVYCIAFGTPQTAIVAGVLGVFLAGVPGTVFHHLLHGIQKVPASNFLIVLGAIISLLCCYLAIRLQAWPWQVAVAYALPPVLISYVGAACYFLARPQLRPAWVDVRREHLGDLLKLGSSFFALSILTAVGLNVDNLIILNNVGADAVSSYSIIVRLGSVLSLLILAVFMPLWTANAEAIARNEHVWVKRTAWRMSAIGLAVVTVSGCLLVLLSDQILLLWVGRSFADQHVILACVVATSAVIAATSPYNMILNAIGRVTAQIWPWLAFVLVSIPLKFALIVPGRLWVAAAITGILYAVLISPAVIATARRALSSASYS